DLRRKHLLQYDFIHSFISVSLHRHPRSFSPVKHARERENTPRPNPLLPPLRGQDRHQEHC
ncbi:hypothetical protein KAX22_09655, partial [bacterium]|nr:hypothetical protein [bacterium]